MIKLDKGNSRFNYRIAGIALNGNSIFVHKAEEDEFWTFPGGRAEIGETAEETLKREMKEELGIDVEVIRLLWFVENFFNYVGMNYHEISLYFLMKFPSDCKYITEQEPFLIEDQGTKFTFKWVETDVNTLSNLPLLPAFLQARIENLPKSIEHVIEDNRK